MSVSCRFVYRFKNKRTDETSEQVVTGVNSKYEAYQIARETMTEELDTTIREFESKWMIEDREVAVGVSKGIEYDDIALRDRLRSLDGIEKVDKVDPDEHSKHMVYYIRTGELLNEDYIIDKVRDMFRSIEPDLDDVAEDILIIVNPPYYPNK